MRNISAMLLSIWKNTLQLVLNVSVIIHFGISSWLKINKSDAIQYLFALFKQS